MYLNSPQKVFIISWSTIWHILHGFGSYTYFKSTYISIYMNFPATSHIQYTFYNAIAFFGKKSFSGWCWPGEAKSGNHGKHAFTFVSPHLFGSFDLRNLNPNINGEIGLHTKSNFNRLSIREESSFAKAPHFDSHAKGMKNAFLRPFTMRWNAYWVSKNQISQEK